MIARFFNSSFDVQRQVETVEEGRVVKTFSTIGTHKGKFDRLSVAREIVSDKKTYRITDNLYCFLIDVKEGDKIIKDDGQEFNVLSVINPFDKNRHLEIGLERIV